MALEDVITYVWLGQALLAMIPWNTDPEIRQMIRTGTVAYELLKPVDLFNLWYTRTIATRTAPTLLRSIPIFILGMAFFGMQMPNSPASAIAFALATIGAVLLSVAISTLLNISLIWTLSGQGITRITAAAVILFSGMAIPLPLFPDWAQTILQLLPFAGLVDTPFRLYVGHIPPEQVIWVLTHQLIWTGIFVLWGRLLLRRGVQAMVVQGG
jgi:ABC-2 type transport system permease protein